MIVYQPYETFYMTKADKQFIKLGRPHRPARMGSVNPAFRHLKLAFQSQMMLRW